MMTRRGTRRTLLSPNKGLAVTKAINAVPGLVAYWPMQEQSGTDLIAYDANGLAPALDGTIHSTTVGVQASAALGLCHSHDGINDHSRAGSAALEAAKPTTKGTVAIFGKVANAGVWTDGSTRALVRSNTATDNFFAQREGINGRLGFSYKGSNVGGTRNVNSLSTTDFFLVTIAWDTVANESRCYFNGALVVGAITPIGVFAADLTSNLFLGGGSSTPSFPWHGYLCHAYIRNITESADQVLSIAQGGGVV